MAKQQRNAKPKRSEPDAVRVPAGAPAWITPELIEHTLRVWQPYYEEPLIPENAVEIIMNIGRLVEVLSCGADHEAVRRSRSRKQP